MKTKMYVGMYKSNNLVTSQQGSGNDRGNTWDQKLNLA